MDSEELFGHDDFKTWHSLIPYYIYKGSKGGIKHVLSHRVLHAAFHELEVEGTLPVRDGFLAVPYENLHHYALPRLVERYMEMQKSDR